MRVMTSVSFFALAALATAFVATPNAALADGHEEKVCNSVIESSKAAVKAGSGVLRHGGTVACPEEEAEPAPEPEAEPTVVSVDADVLFDFDSAALKADAASTLDAAIADLAGVDGTINVIGHTDSTGSDAYNQGLSERRAQSVANYMTANGVSAEQISVSGKGESEPVGDNSTREGRAENRRVDIVY